MTDAIQFLTSQHREMEQLWSTVQAATSPETRGGPAQELIRMLSGHDALETQFLYPELRSSAGESGTQLAEHSLDEHQQVRELLAQAERQGVATDEALQTLTQCMTAVMAHVEEEEGRILPLLQASVDAERLTDMGQKMEQMFKMAPTHPHPHTPDNKLGATIAGAASGVVDRVRDAVMPEPGKSD